MQTKSGRQDISITPVLRMAKKPVACANSKTGYGPADSLRVAVRSWLSAYSMLCRS